MRAALTVLCVVVAALGCEERPRSVLELSVKEKPVPVLPARPAAPAKRSDAPVSYNLQPPLPAARVGDEVLYAFTLRPAPTDTFNEWSAQARFRVLKSGSDEARVAVVVDRSPGAPGDVSFRGTLVVRSPVEDRLGVTALLDKCLLERRCHPEPARHDSPDVVLAPPRLELGVADFLLSFDQQQPTGRGKHIALLSTQPTEGVPDARDEGTVVETHLTPVSWVWHRVMEKAQPLPGRAGREDVTGTMPQVLRQAMLAARDRSMDACGRLWPKPEERPPLGVSLRLRYSGTWGKITSSEVLSDTQANNPWVRCIQRELGNAEFTDIKGQPPQIMTVELWLPPPD